MSRELTEKTLGSDVQEQAAENIERKILAYRDVCIPKEQGAVFVDIKNVD